MHKARSQLRLGAMFAPTNPIDQLPGFVDRVEELGFDELWFAEDCFEHGAFSAATFALCSSSRISVGIGLLPVPMRNVAVTAMEIATLAQLHPGRLDVCFGHGVESWMQQIGARPKNRVAYLAEVADAVSRLLRGEEMTTHGDVVLDRVRLAQVPSTVPSFLIGTTGERGLQVAADLRFGLLMPEGAGTGAVQWARNSVAAGSKVVIYSWLSIAEDDDAAEEALLGEARDWRRRGLYPNLYELGGLPAANKITQGMLSNVAVVGSPSTCARRLQDLQAAGADAVVFIPIGADAAATLKRVQREVAPLLRAA